MWTTSQKKNTAELLVTKLVSNNYVQLVYQILDLILDFAAAVWTMIRIFYQVKSYVRGNVHFVELPWTSDEEMIERCTKRVEVDDAEAMCQLG